MALTSLWTAKRNDQWHVILDGHEQKGYDQVELLTFSSDGKRFAYIASTDDKACIVLDGVEGPALTRSSSGFQP